MGKSLISNLPYNLKWTAPPFAQLQKRFIEYDVPPNSNANFAFILTSLEQIDDKAAFILPNGVLTTSDKKEAHIRKLLVEDNVIEAIIILPDKMFESTSIGTCIIVLSKNKKTTRIEMVDLRQKYIEVEREQNGQFGGASHENRTYKKTVKVITDECMDLVLKAIGGLEDNPEFTKACSIDEIRKNEYILTPSRYIEIQERDNEHRSYEDIANDYNRIVKEKNALKLTVNESLAKVLGIYDMAQALKSQPDIAKSFEVVGQKAEIEAFISLSKNKAEFKIENKNTESVPEILLLFLNMWEQHIMYLNTEENRLLAEFRDALLPDLMSGKVEIK